MNKDRPGDTGFVLTTPGQVPSPGASMPSDPAPVDGERRSLRQRLLDARNGLPDRAQREAALVNRVARWLKTMPVSRLAFYSPIRGEPDLTRVIAAWLAEERGRTAALPVVSGDVLEFRAWTPGLPLVPDAYGIPVPQGTPTMQPQVLFVPCIGIDDNRHRLGYGGGYFDRTLGRMRLKPVTVGVGFDCGRIRSIRPEPHDVRLDLAITETGVL